MIKSIVRILIIMALVTFSFSPLGPKGVQAKEEKVKGSKKSRVDFKKGAFLEAPDRIFKLRPYLKSLLLRCLSDPVCKVSFI